MNIEDQVCSLELSKRLRELNIEQDSIFYWIKSNNPKSDYHIAVTSGYCKNLHNEKISAFTVAELGVMLPNCINKPDQSPFDNYRLVIRKFISVDEDMTTTNNFIVNYECDTTEVDGADAWITRKLGMNFYDKNLANAMAKMLIYLIENGFIKS